jgi:flotillin
MSLLIVAAAAAVAFVAICVILVKSMYRIAEPNEAMIISGLRAHAGDHGDVGGPQGLGFKIVVGKGVFVVPGLQTVRRLSLDIHESELQLECVTMQGIRVGVKAVVIYKIADDFESIANAARRFLEQEGQMDAKVHNVFAGHLRSIVGSLTVEQMIRDRESLTSKTRESSASEMAKLGLTIDSLQIQEIDDLTGYIENLSKPHTATVEKEARIAQAGADREATEREQEAEALKAAALSQSQIQQAKVMAEASKAQATAAQAGPLAEAQAKQAVVEQETKVAGLEAQRKEAELFATVQKPADAEAYRTKINADAARQATISAAEAEAQKTKLLGDAQASAEKARGEGEAAAIGARGEAEGAALRAKGLAEADSIKARAAALAENQEAVVAQQVAQNLPAIVEAASKAFGNIDRLTVLNGAEGMGQLFNQVLGMGAAAIPAIRSVLEDTHLPEPPATNGHKEAPVEVPPAS